MSNSIEGRGGCAKVLVFGDSLTAGFHSNGMEFEPYGKVLEEKLGGCVAVTTIGMSGWTSLSLLETCDEEHLEDFVGSRGVGLRCKLKDGDGFDAAIILAGTNDFAEDDVSPLGILENLKGLHKICHDHGVKSIALGIPGSRFMSNASMFDEIRREVNGGLEQFANESGNKVMFIDVALDIPFSDESGLWEADGLHLSGQGYRYLGELVALKSKEFLLTGGPNKRNGASLVGLSWPDPCAEFTPSTNID